MKWALPAHPMIRPCLTPRGEPKYTLLICPFAGGSSSAFRQWSVLENPDIAVSLVIYPGRDNRMNERAVTEIAPLAQSLADLLISLTPAQRENLILVGHSMGAQVAFETCQRLEQHDCSPKALVLSGCHAPHLQSCRQLSGLPDHEFIEQLIDIGGCSPILREDPDLLSLFLPMLRADFWATEHYHHVIQSDSVKLQTPTLLLYGNEDKEASAQEVQQWHHWLSGDKQNLSYCCQEIVGNHFYITQEPQSFIRHVTQFMQYVYPQGVRIMAPYSIPGKNLTMTPDYLWNGETIDQQLAGWASLWGDKTALIYQEQLDQEQRLTYRELHQAAERLASGLFQRGIRRGDNVMVQLPNRISFVVTCFALFRLGAHPVLLMPTQRAHDVHALCQIAHPVAYIIPDCIHGFDYREMAREVAASCPDMQHVIVDGEAEEFTALASIDSEPLNVSGPCYGDIAVLLLSGGTTGTPKLIPRTHDAYTYDFVLSARLCSINTESVYLAVLPVAHNFTLGSPGILGTLSQGGCVLLSDTASCDEAMPLIEQHKVTHVALVPALARLWEQARDWEQSDLSSLRCLQVGGGRLTPELAEQVMARLGPLQQVFGTAEGLLCYTRLDDPHEVIINTQGRPLSEEDEIKIVDANLQPVAPGEVGELMTRGPYTITGYYRAEQHNTVAFTTDGFYRTGDLVRIRPDGNLIVEGRIKEQINRSGEKISTQEVETLLLQHPDIDDAVVIAVPDELLGERICACIPKNGNQPEPTQMQAFLHQKGVQRHKIPDQWLFVAYWPLTTVGKIDKRQLVQMAQAEHGSPMQQYHEHTIAITSTPLDLVTHLLANLTENDAQPCTLYEIKGEWSLGIGCAATIRADASGQLVDSKGNHHPYDISTLSQKLELALNALPIKDWRAYGRTLFEFSHMTYGIPLDPSLEQQNEALIKITVPQHELRITQGQVLIRTLEENQITILSEKVRLADQAGTPVFPYTKALEIINTADAEKHYQDNVANAVKDIAAGHYQKVILSRKVELGSNVDITHSYWLGRQANTPARSFFLRDEEFSAYGFSPETVVEADGSGWVNSQPLAGTRALTHNKEQDQRLKADLLSDPKEIAEHAVSAKLALEELAPICQAETLCVTEFMAVRERGSVQHLASRVKGLLQTDKNRWDAFIALFPAVTASGIPKKPSLEAIARYEGEPRRLYSGCVMLLDSTGKLDAALVLRSFYQHKGRSWLQAGAGLVRDSKPEREWQETCEKLECIMKYVRA